MKIALFASGKGTNVENIIRYFNGNKSVNISVIYSNNKNSGAILHAKKHQIPGILLNKEDLSDSNELVNELNSSQIDLVVLAGFLVKIPRKFIEEFNGKIINVQGDGVVGEFPTLKPGESFEYTSGTPLKTTNGIMQGFYLMSQNNGDQLKIDIPTFSLDSPYNNKKFH